MKIRFWGVRGSIPSPGPHTLRYGGNTTCIEVRTDADELLILDAGTGIFPALAVTAGQMPLTANVLLSHTHWDHIQGLPFFVPNFVPGNTLRLHGAFDPVSGRASSRPWRCSCSTAISRCAKPSSRPASSTSR
jgi:phosphoribosyl 1,2-cyclic phosphodiesterase